MALGVIESAELGGGLVQARVGSCNRMLASGIPRSVSECRFSRFDVRRPWKALTENGSTPLALVANDSTHGG